MFTEKSKNSLKKYSCEKCNYYSNNKKDFKKHLETKKHNVDTKRTNVYKCICGKQYKYRQSLYRHKQQCKKSKITNQNTEWINMDKKWINMDKSEKCPFSYICECGKTYKYQSGLSKHKKICKVLNENENKNIIQENTIIKYEKNDISELKDMFIKLLEKNDETNDKLLELAKEPKTNITNNTQFNVMNYLNTECKDAMNFSDFINDFVFSLDDLNLLHEKGYQEAMEQTFIKQLRDMDKTKRPIHCSDKKRKSFYIKDKDIWIKDENNLKILDGVKEITHKQFGTIKQWATYNKDWLDVEKKQDFFNMSISELSKAKKEKYLNKLIIKLTSLSLK
jgi:hypothetical protein